MDVAKILGVQKEFQNVVNSEETKNQMLERYNKLVKK